MGKKWGVRLADIQDDAVGEKIDEMFDDAKSVMQQRTADFPIFQRISHNQSLYEKNKDTQFSEGSTQAIKRKIRAQTLQRVPDGELVTQFDKNSVEQVEVDYLFKNKILTSEFDGKDMLKNLWRTFNAAYDYGFACVRTGFEKDLDGDVRVSYKLIQWNDVFPSPDCDFIEEAEWYVIREYVSISEIRSLMDPDTGQAKDPTYVSEVLQFLDDYDPEDGQEYNSIPLADKKHGVTKIESVEVRTLYRRGDKEFFTYVPGINAVLRKVKNEDPRRDIPLHFLILEPDPEFPLGASSAMWTVSQQQYADAFQTSSYQTLLLATQPPIMATGNLTNAKIRMQPKAFWNLGNNPNNKIEKFPVETTTITQYGSILENVGANMMKNMNISDATIASDANVARYSGTAPGVHEQAKDKTITINQYAKRIETFFSEWANHALRSYLSSMRGKKWVTFDEASRRRIWDIEMARDADAEAAGEDPGETVIDGDKVEVDFDKLSSDTFEFKVRSGSLVETREEEERRTIQEMLIPVSQMMGNISDSNRDAFEKNIMQMVARLFELADIDISAQASQRVDEKLMLGALNATMQQVQSQQGQIDDLMAKYYGQQGYQASVQKALQQQGMGGQMQAQQPPMPQQQTPVQPQGQQAPVPQQQPGSLTQ